MKHSSYVRYWLLSAHHIILSVILCAVFLSYTLFKRFASQLPNFLPFFADYYPNLNRKSQIQIKMSISEFRKKKLLYVFNVFFDVNQSGTIDRKDFELAIEKICTMRGWKPSDDQYKKTHESMIRIWDGLRQRADANKDGQVSVDEWCSMWDEYSKNPERALDWQTNYMVFMFHMEDASGDGSIDVDEFTSVCSCYGLKPDECRLAFQHMSKGNPEVSYDHFVALWKEFFTSENPSDAGNFIFGKTNF